MIEFSKKRNKSCDNTKSKNHREGQLYCSKQHIATELLSLGIMVIEIEDMP